MKTYKIGKLARGLMVATTMAGLLYSAPGQALTQLNQIGGDNWPFAVAPIRTGQIATPAAGMSQKSIYVASGATPTAGGDLCDKSTTGIRVYDISRPTNPKFVNIVLPPTAPRATRPQYLKTVHIDIDYVNYPLVPLRLNNTNVLLGTKTSNGIVINADPGQ